LIEREFYPLNQAAEIIGCSVDDLVHLGASGRVQIIALVKGRQGVLHNADNKAVHINPKYLEPKIEIINDRYNFVHKDIVSRYEAGRTVGGGSLIAALMSPDGSGNYWKLSRKEDYIFMSDTSLFLLTQDINSLRNTATSQVSATQIEQKKTKPDIYVSAQTENQAVLTEDTPIPIYERRKKSCDKWVEEKQINLKALEPETVHDQLKQIKNDKKLWTQIKDASFLTEFWHKYSHEKNLNRQRGRPKKTK
jgi:hypothetical protein